MEILVVDDNKEICILVENILLSEGYDVESCCNPLEFHQVLNRVKPKLIITDMLMSGFDGRTLTKEVRSNPPYSTYENYDDVCTSRCAGNQ